MPSVAQNPPPSQARVNQTIAISDELGRLSREQLVALARQAKGSLKHNTESKSAVEIARRLRDEWHDRV